MTKFNPISDKIAVVIKQFRLKKSSEFFADKYSEPYILSFAIDEHGTKEASIDFNILSFPKVKKGDVVSFDDQGHLVYGPKKPGNFLSYSILFMESDKDIRELGKIIEEIIKAKAFDDSMKTLLSLANNYTRIAFVVQKIAEVLAIQLKNNKDDELFRRNGTLFKDSKPPFDILRTYQSENNFIQMQTAIIPLSSSNQLGSQVKKIKLK